MPGVELYLEVGPSLFAVGMTRRRRVMRSLDTTLRVTCIRQGNKHEVALPIIASGFEVPSAGFGQDVEGSDENLSPSPMPSTLSENIVDDENLDDGDRASSYAERQRRCAEAWASVREKLRKAVVVGFALPPEHCCVEGCSRPACMRCRDCGAQVFFCQECAEQDHTAKCLFHRMELWNVSRYQITRLTLVLERMY